MAGLGRMRQMEMIRLMKDGGIGCRLSWGRMYKYYRDRGRREEEEICSCAETVLYRTGTK